MPASLGINMWMDREMEDGDGSFEYRWLDIMVITEAN